MKDLSPYLKHSIPHFGAISLFLLINIVFFYPQFQGKKIGQDDLNESHGQVREYVLHSEETGSTPLWTNNIYIGQPAFYNGLSFSNPLLYLEQVLQLFFGRPTNVFFLSMLSTYLALLVFGMSPWIAALGGIGYGMATNNLILFQAGHMMKIGSLMYMPFIIAGLILITKKDCLKGFIFFTLGMAMSILHHHVQMIFYLMMILLILGVIILVEWIKKKDFTFIGKALGIVLLGTTVAIGANLSRMWTTYEFSSETIRGENIIEPANDESSFNFDSSDAGNGNSNSDEGSNPTSKGLDWDYAMAWSNNTLDVLTGIVPGIVGGSSGERLRDGASYTALRRAGVAPQADGSYRLPLYWGALPFTSGPIYFGAVILFLFMLGLFLQKGPIKWWIASAVVFTILLSYGKHQEWINRFLFDYFPLFSKFRTPNSVLSVTTLLFPILASFGLVRWFELSTQQGSTETSKSKSNRKKRALNAQLLNAPYLKYLVYSFALTAGLCAFIALTGPSLFSFQGAGDSAYAQSGLLPYILEDRKAMMVSDAWRSFILISISAIGLWGYAVGKVKKEWVLMAIVALTIFDFWGVNRRYIHPADFKENSEQIIEEYYVERDIDRQIYVLEEAKGEYNRGNYRVLDLSINTFNTNKTTYFHNTIGGYTAVKLQRIQDMIDYHISRLNRSVLNMLNTTYIINQNQQLIVNDEALGWAWLVKGVREVTSPREEIEALYGFSPADTAIVLKSEFDDYLEGLQPTGEGNILRTDYQLDYWKYEYKTDSEQLAVFSEMWYTPEKGLHAYVNGERADFIRVNYMLRAIKVPAGEGVIEFRFEPTSYLTGQPITLAAAWGLIALLITWLGLQIRTVLRTNA